MSGARLGLEAFLRLALACAAIFLLGGEAVAQTCADRTPTRQPFFGDVHVHTALFFDAYTFETRLCTVGNLQTPACQAIRAGNFGLVGFYFGSQFTSADPQRRSFCGTNGQLCLQAAASPWNEIRLAAAEFNDPAPACQFSTFIGYEWTASPGGDTGHGNVLFKGSNVPSLPQSYVEVQDPFALWTVLDTQCASVGGDCEAITIAHNSNLSAGVSFQTTSPSGAPLTFSEALFRR